MVRADLGGCDHDAAADLRRQARRWGDGGSSLSLWLVEDSPAMAPCIARIQEIEGALVFPRLALGGSRNVMLDDAVHSAVAFAVDALAVSAVVVCGGSLGSGGESSGPRPPREGSGYERLLRGLQRREKRLGLMRRRVVEFLEELKRHPSIRRAFPPGRAPVHGMLYLAECGRFTIYDPQSGRFVPLDEAWTAGV